MSLRFKDMVGIIQPTMYIDEFSSKISDDAEIVVLSFYVSAELAAEDLISWFEKGYKFVVDADRSPGEVSPNRFLVFIEMERDVKVIEQIKEILDDLATLTEFTLPDWTIIHKGQKTRYSPEKLRLMVNLSPQTYRINNEQELNEIRQAAGLDVKTFVNEDDPYIKMLLTQSSR